MKINPREDEARMQAAVGIGVFKFLCEECDKHGGIITLEEMSSYGTLAYSLTLPPYVPHDFAKELISDTVHIVLKVLIDAMMYLGTTQLNSKALHMLVDKFTEERLYKIIKASQVNDNDEEV